jgi:hypothetical protein
MTMLVLWLELPLTMLTEPTVPAMEDLRVADARSASALLREAWALVTAASSETMRVAEDWPVPPL